jgi:quercetin dioxygenase-like cupin family protein
MAAQQPEGIKRTDLQQHDLSISGREVIQARVDIGPEAPLVKHTHPGEENHLCPGKVTGVSDRGPIADHLQGR